MGEKGSLMITVHHLENSRSLRILWMLEELELAYEIKPYKRLPTMQAPPELKAVHPLGKSPAITDDGVTMAESGAIIEYLEEVYPIPQLLPKDPVGRARVRAIRDIVGCDMHPVNNLRIRNFVRATYKQDAEGVAAWIQLWNKAGYEAIEAMLRADKNRKGFCYGDTPTMADCCLVPQVFNAQRYKCDLTPFPTAMRVFAECMNHEAFDRAQPSKQPEAATES